MTKGAINTFGLALAKRSAHVGSPSTRCRPAFVDTDLNADWLQQPRGYGRCCRGVLGVRPRRRAGGYR